MCNPIVLDCCMLYLFSLIFNAKVRHLVFFFNCFTCFVPRPILDFHIICDLHIVHGHMMTTNCTLLLNAVW